MKSRRTALLAALICLATAAAPAQASRLYAVTQTPVRSVFAFDSAAPGTIVSSAPITGLATPTEVIKGLDLRPGTGEVILLTRSATSTVSRIYRLDVATGVATQGITLSPGLPSDVELGVDVDPIEDNLRLIGTDESNRTVNLASGALATHSFVDLDADLDAIAYRANGNLVAFNSSADGRGGHNGNENDGVFGPLAAAGLGTDSGFAARSSFDMVADTELITAVKGGAQTLFAGPFNGPDVEVGPISGNPDVRGMTVVDNVIRHASASASTVEGESATLYVGRESPRGSAAVSWSAQGGDGGPSAGTVTFAEGETAKTLSVPVPQDTEVEPEESFTVTLGSTTNGAAVVGARAATIRVLDDERPAVAGPDRLVPFAVVVPPPVAALLAGRCANPQIGTVGDDALIGTVAGDGLAGGAGADALVGRDGDDCLDGGPGNDWLNSADGNDLLRGGSGEDFMLGGRGNDVMTGANGDDRIVGGAGADSISGGGGSNHLLGGSGNDRINARNGRRDVIDCGGGRDRVTIDIRRDKTNGCEVIPGT